MQGNTYYLVLSLNNKSFLNTYHYLSYSQFERVWTSESPLFTASVATKINSPYFKFLQLKMRNIMESGLLEHYQNMNSKSLKVCETEKTEGNPLGYLKLATLFFVLAIGMVFTGVVFIYELCHHKSQKHSTNHHQQEN